MRSYLQVPRGVVGDAGNASEWVVVPNAHPALISEGQARQILDIRSSRKRLEQDPAAEHQATYVYLAIKIREVGFSPRPLHLG